jgi:hypothetical protein
MADYPLIHCLVYGATGMYKTRFAGTFPTPHLVLAFDPYDKMTPFLQRGNVEPVQDPFYTQLGLEAVQVSDRQTGAVLSRIEYYADPDPSQPTAYQKFVDRVPSLSSEAAGWGTIILDSLTFLQNAFLRYDEKVLNKQYKEPRLYYADLRRELVSQLLARFVWLKTNVVVIAHVSDRKDEFGEGLLRGANAVGQLIGELPAGYGETYRAYVKAGTGKERMFALQTQADNIWYAASQINAPDGCEPTYEALWSNYK